jgi:ATP-dependent DNA helicase RecG
MDQNCLENLIDKLISLPKENEYVEFKKNNHKPDDIGERISALSNSANLFQESFGYLVFGIENETHEITGTNFRPSKEKIGNMELENWLMQMLEPKIDFRIYEFKYKGKENLVLFKIPAAVNRPTDFKNVPYVRVGSVTRSLKEFPEKQEKIWISRKKDFSAEICEGATLADLDSEAILRARKEYKEKYPKQVAEVDSWDDAIFLNKAKITKQGKITKTAIILLGKSESEHFLNPAIAKITWVLKDEKNNERDYEHFSPPFLINSEKLNKKIRNLTYRYLPDNSLFPKELSQYVPYIIREILHNCIAHQDYEMGGKINVVEKPEELIFTNLGSFIPLSIENVIRMDAPPEYYRNPFLVSAMVNLNMIDTIGSGIKRMFNLQKKRSFPLPDYDLSDKKRVSVKIYGKILDENYTRLLISDPELDLMTVISLDKVQKRKPITKDEVKFLKSKKLIEGRSPNFFVSAYVAHHTGSKAQYIKNRAFDDKYYKDLITAYLKKEDVADRKDIDTLIIDKLSDVLSYDQKRNKVRNLIYAMSKRENTIINTGTSKNPKWKLRGG